MGKAEIWTSEQVRAVNPHASYRAFDLIEAGPELIRTMLEELVEHFESGRLRPLPVRAFAMRDVERAFRHMARAQHTGKIVLLPPDSELEGLVRSDGSYLVSGGLGALGLEAARWLAEQGAREVILLGRRAPDAQQEQRLATIRELGTRVEVRATDVSDRAELAALLAELEQQGTRMRGVIHAAGVLDDAALLNQTWDKYQNVQRAKAQGAWNLHCLTEAYELDFFVLYSSVASLLGPAAQANYAAANAFLDGLAHHRRFRGLPALSINWGPWASAGMAAASTERELRRRRAAGFGEIGRSSGLRALALLLRADSRSPRSCPSIPGRVQSRAGSGGTPAAAVRLDRKAPPTPAARCANCWRPCRSRRGTSGLSQRSRGRCEWCWGSARAIGFDRQATGRAGAGLADGRRAAQPALERVRRGAGHDRRVRLPDRRRPIDVLGVEGVAAGDLQRRAGGRANARQAERNPQTARLARTLARGGDQRSDGAALDDGRTTQPIERRPASDRGAAEGAATLRELERSTSRSRSSAWAAGFRAAPNARRVLGTAEGGTDAGDRSAGDRWDVDAYYDPDPGAREDVHAQLGRSRRRTVRCRLLRHRRRARRRRWIRSSGCCSRWPGRRSSDAGIAPSRWPAAAPACSSGISDGDYASATRRRPDRRSTPTSRSAARPSVAAGRLSYVARPARPEHGRRHRLLLVAGGASTSPARACASGECDLALAGGVNLILLAATTIVAVASAAMLAPDGPLQDASTPRPTATCAARAAASSCSSAWPTRWRDGDRILAVIRGIAVNQDGRSSGLTAPNGPAQEAVIREALAQRRRRAGARSSYVEAHGTGTPLGDPIEVQALAAVLGEGRAAGASRFVLGSVKTNIGHLEAAAGIAGLIKVVLALQHGRDPAAPALRAPEPAHRLGRDLPVRSRAQRHAVASRQRDARIAGVSSFGFSGTNAHVIVESAELEARSDEATEGEEVVVVSSRSAEGLREQARRYGSYLNGAGRGSRLSDVSYTSSVCRSHFERRVAVIGGDVASVANELMAYAEGGVSGRVIEGQSVRGASRVCFMFTGQGAQYAGMGRGLYERGGAFRRALERCDQALREELEVPLLEVLYGASSSDELLKQTAYAQPALFALEYALSEQWSSWGVRPAYVMGHSLGEYVAACVSGALELESGLRLVARVVG